MSPQECSKDSVKSYWLVPFPHISSLFNWVGWRGRPHHRRKASKASGYSKTQVQNFVHNVSEDSQITIMHPAFTILSTPWPVNPISLVYLFLPIPHLSLFKWPCPTIVPSCLWSPYPHLTFTPQTFRMFFGSHSSQHHSCQDYQEPPFC